MTDKQTDKKIDHRRNTPNLTWFIDGKHMNKQEVKDFLIEQVSTNGKNLHSIKRHHPAFPDVTTVYPWFKKDEKFAQQYAQAKRTAMDFMAEEIVTIADDGSNDYMEIMDKNGDPTGAWKFKGEHVMRSKLRIDTRKWIMSKLMPSKYGEKIQVEHTQTPLKEKTYEQLEEMARKLLSQRVVSEQ